MDWKNTMLHDLGARLGTYVRKREFLWPGSLLLLGVLLRAWLWFSYEPISYGDTGSYMRLGEALKDISFSGYDGTRVPGYPAFLALLDLQPDRVWLVQMLLGLMISMLLYWITWRTTNSMVLGFVVGALYNLIPGQFLFEANLLTETLTTFFVVLSLCLFVCFTRVRSPAWRYGLVLLLGVAVSMVGLIRPLFFPLTIWFLPFVWLAAYGDWKKKLLFVALYSLGPLVLQGSWLVYMKQHYHVISPTAMAGYSLVQHTGEYFEFLPDEYASIRDTYIRFRDAQIAARGVQTNAIWEAIPEISEASGLGFYELAREMQRLSWWLIRHHPDLYLKNVIAGWISFWKAPVYWRPEAVQSVFAMGILSGMAIVGRGISLLANFLFLVFSALVAASAKWRRRLHFDLISMAVGGMIWMISILQTLLDHGDNPRFLVPLQVLVLYLVVRSLWFWSKGRVGLEDIDR
jgi:hypothetical protein